MYFVNNRALKSAARKKAFVPTVKVRKNIRGNFGVKKRKDTVYRERKTIKPNILCLFWCEGRDLNPYGCPHAPQTCASACSATLAKLNYYNKFFYCLSIVLDIKTQKFCFLKQMTEIAPEYAASGPVFEKNCCLRPFGIQKQNMKK